MSLRKSIKKLPEMLFLKGKELRESLYWKKINRSLNWEETGMRTQAIIKISPDKLFRTLHRDVDPVIFLFPEFNFSVGKGKKSMIFSQSDIKSWFMFCTSLAYNNIAGFGCLASE